MESDPLILLISFALSFLIAIVIYWIGGKISAKTKQINGEKTIPYACGEEPSEVREVRINLERFFIYAIYFLIFDVFAFLIVISWSATWIYPTIYSIVVFMAVLAFLIARRRL